MLNSAESEYPEEEADIQPKEKETKLTKLKFYASIVSYAVGILLYVVDIISDIMLGRSLVQNAEGKIILAFIFLPVLAQILLVVAAKISSKGKKITISQDRLTLVGIDWFGLDDEDILKTIYIIILVVFRVHILRVYLLLIKATCEKNKKLKKELDTRMRAEMFMETCFESLPQCCIQLYLFGEYSTVSHLQIFSFTMSTVTLVYSFTLAHVEREVEIYYYALKEKNKLGIRITPGYEDEVDGINKGKERAEEGEYFTKKNKFNGNISLKKAGDRGIHLKLVNQGTPPPRTLEWKVDLQFKEEIGCYEVYEATVKSKQLDAKVERDYFFWMRVSNIVIESPVFFLTAFPTISLFSCLFGHKFLLFYIPIAIHFLAEYWWWRPYRYRLNMNASFHTIFLAFKFLERITILGMICIWFIKVQNYSEPLKPHNPNQLPALVWPEQNQFLATVASYEKDGVKQKWAKGCVIMKASTSNITYNFSPLKIREVYTTFDRPQICAIDAAAYITCVVFYMNLIGMIWEFLNYIIFFIYKWLTKYEVWGKTEKIAAAVENYTQNVSAAVGSYTQTMFGTPRRNKNHFTDDSMMTRLSQLPLPGYGLSRSRNKLSDDFEETTLC